MRHALALGAREAPSPPGSSPVTVPPREAGVACNDPRTERDSRLRSVRDDLQEGLALAKFIIAPHMRLHEWVAEEKGYFRDAGLDYEFRDQLRSAAGKVHDLGDRSWSRNS